MVKPVSRPLSQYSLDALALLGQLVREARLGKAMTTTDLAARAGISRALLQRIERGDPGCSIGVVFEVASVRQLRKTGRDHSPPLRQSEGDLAGLFSRIVFNILCGNTDDHARNHAAFWDGHQLALTPAYDICPQSRSGQPASQAMLIRGAERTSQVGVCIAAASVFLLSQEEAKQIINHQVKTIDQKWPAICEEAALSEVDQALFWRRPFLNPFAFINAPDCVHVPLPG